MQGGRSTRARTFLGFESIQRIVGRFGLSAVVKFQFSARSFLQEVLSIEPTTLHAPVPSTAVLGFTFPPRARSSSDTGLRSLYGLLGSTPEMLMNDDNEGWFPPRLTHGSEEKLPAKWRLERTPLPEILPGADRIEEIAGLQCALLIVPDDLAVFVVTGTLQSHHEATIAGLRRAAEWDDFESVILTRGQTTTFAMRNPESTEIVVIAVDRARANYILVRKAMESCFRSWT